MKRPVSYLEMDAEKGELSAANGRFVLLPAGFLIQSQKQVEKIVGPASAALHYRVGCGIGEEYINIMERVAKEFGEEIDVELLLMQAYETSLVESGFGMVRVREFDLEKSRIVVKVKNSPTKDEKGCDLLRGIIGGIAMRVLKDCTCVEVEHGETCEFEVRK